MAFSPPLWAGCIHQAFHALYDTKTPLRFAIVRVVLTTSLGFLFALWLPRPLGIDPKWGVAGLTISAGLSGWVEFALLRRALTRRIGAVSLPHKFLIILWTSAFAGAALGYGVKRLMGTGHPLPLAVLSLGTYGAVYLCGTYRLGIDESRGILKRVWPA